MGTANARDQGRESFTRRAWGEAYAQLSAADLEAPLEPEDLDRLATAALLLGHDSVGEGVWVRAHHGFLSRGDAERAARCAFWLGFALLNKGEMARGGGWLATAQRVLDDAQRDCVERGYLLIPLGIRCFREGDSATAFETFGAAAAIASRFRDPDLSAFSRHGRGRSLVRLGRAAEGVALLDEVMVSVTAGEVSPMVAGVVYCSVIEACRELFDVRRAREWTAALTRWCALQPDLVPFRGECLVHRAEIMRMHGAWTDAVDAAQQACERLVQSPDNPPAGPAFYQQGEIQRLRGDLAKAEASYRRASERGHEPQPGLALLRLSQGRIDAAVAAIQRVADDSQDHLARAKVLPAYVEIMLAAGNEAGAHAAAAVLAEIAATIDTPLLEAFADNAMGAVLLAEGDARAALGYLRRAWAAWQAVEAPYEAARARALIGLAYRQLGDWDSAEMELNAARLVFRQLGAALDLARVDELSRKAPVSSAGGLTGRELEVLRLVATGKTNRAIADELVISEKTVARHVSNIFAKLGLSSRAEATAHAYRHDLV